jgi:hypothetical protein
MMHIRLQAIGRQFSTPQDYGLSPEKWLENDNTTTTRTVRKRSDQPLRESDEARPRWRGQVALALTPPSTGMA